MAALAHARLTLQRSARLLATSPGRLLGALVLVAIAVVVAGAMQVTRANVDAWSSRWRGGAAAVVYLDRRVDDARAEQIAAQLRALPAVERVEYVRPAAAAARLRAALGHSAELLDGVDDAAMPATLELVLEPGGRDVIVASPLLAALRGADAVRSVELDGEWVDQLEQTIDAGAHLSRGLADLTLLAMGLLVLGVLRLALVGALTGGGEAAVARMLGAGAGYVLWPSALVGVAVGASGALLGLGTLNLLVARSGEAMTGPMREIVGGGVVGVPGQVALLLLVGGAALGALAGLLAGTSRAAR